MSPRQRRTRVLLVRHGETSWNVTGTLQGQHDVHLNDKGMLQAQLIATRLADDVENEETRRVAVCVSDLSRAVQTAEHVTSALIKKTNGELYKDVRLREFNSGIFTGGTLAEAKRDHPLAWQRYVTEDDYVVPKGESIEGFTHRVLQAFDELTTKHDENTPGCTLIIVTHGGVIDVIKQHRLSSDEDAPMKLHKAHNASLSVLEMTRSDGRYHYRVLTWNDTTHLAELDSKKGTDDAR